ncbi:MAG: Trm112 family protein [Promethearchaeota archaeon]
MKPWLFDILACPIDKFYPLILYIFKYETKSEEFKVCLEIFNNRDIEAIKKENIIQIKKENDKILISDSIFLKKSSLHNYLSNILSSIKELNNFFDKSDNEGGKKCLELLRTIVKDSLEKFSENPNIENLDNILPELYLLNKYKIETEIESGLLFCEKCKRWYPIIESIPQMLPDDYRDKKKDLEFLKTVKNLLDEGFLNQELKPYNL